MSNPADGTSKRKVENLTLDLAHIIWMSVILTSKG